MEKIGTIKAIKEFFEAGPDARKVEMHEFKELTREERHELAALCAVELGKELEITG